MPPGVGHEPAGLRPVSGKGRVRHPGGFRRAAAGGAGGDGDPHDAALPDAAAGGDHVSGLFARHDGAGAGEGAADAPRERRVPAGGRGRASV